MTIVKWIEICEQVRAANPTVVYPDEPDDGLPPTPLMIQVRCAHDAWDMCVDEFIRQNPHDAIVHVGAAVGGAEARMGATRKKECEMNHICIHLTKCKMCMADPIESCNRYCSADCAGSKITELEAEVARLTAENLALRCWLAKFADGNCDVGASSIEERVSRCIGCLPKCKNWGLRA